VADSVVIVKRRGRKLRSASNLRALLASLLRELEASSLPLAERAKMIAYTSQVMVKVMEAEHCGWDAKVREAGEVLRKIRADLDAYKDSPEFAAFMRRRALEEKRDAEHEQDEIDPGVQRAQAEAHRALLDAERTKQEDARDAQFLGANVPSLVRGKFNQGD
jgi:hypothetical protein